jgi:hypothetical protein
MKRIPMLTCLMAAALTCHGQAPVVGTDDDADISAARGAVKDLAMALKAELGSAMQAGGPVAAIEVCKAQAMPITRDTAAGHGLAVSRVSLRNRNPANAPNAWQAQVLETFESQRAAGADAAGLSWWETVETGSGREFRYMQAIPTAGICLTCHGAQLAPGISEVLAEAYPDDRATGFAEGDIRGAFVVTRKVSD